MKYLYLFRDANMMLSGAAFYALLTGNVAVAYLLVSLIGFLVFVLESIINHK